MPTELCKTVLQIVEELYSEAEKPVTMAHLRREVEKRHDSNVSQGLLSSILWKLASQGEVELTTDWCIVPARVLA